MIPDSSNLEGGQEVRSAGHPQLGMPAAARTKHTGCTRVGAEVGLLCSTEPGEQLRWRAIRFSPCVTMCMKRAGTR